MSKIKRFFSSTRLTAILLFLFALACAIGTFIENDYGTPAVRAAVYNTVWFEMIMLLLMINFLFVISKFQMIQKRKWTILLFHLGFVVILLGAFISRYTGFEGIVHIREGESTDYMLSDQLYGFLTVDEEEVSQKIYPNGLIDTDLELELDGYLYRSIKYVENANPIVSEGSQVILELVIATEGQRTTVLLEKNQIIRAQGKTIGFNAMKPCNIQILIEGNRQTLTSDKSGNVMRMADQKSKIVREKLEDTLKIRSLYRINDLSFVIKQVHQNSSIDFVASDDRRSGGKNMMKLEVSKDGEAEQIWLPVEKMGVNSYDSDLGDDVQIAIGPKKIPLGFELYLTDFDLVRYPGSSSPSEFSSYLTVIDGSESYDYTIFMNNVLDHGGYRFFQANYDTDEKGTILSVNHDWWGTNVTYLGYFMLFLGMIISLFNPNSRFRYVSKRLKELSTVVALIFTVQLSAQTDEIPGVYSDQVADEFGSIVVQDMDGRLKPVNTLSLEMIRKITGGSKFNLMYGDKKHKLSANQLFLAFHSKPGFWAFTPVIAIDPEKGHLIFDNLNIDPVEYLSIRDFFDEEGNYLLENLMNDVHNIKQDQRSIFESEVIKVDERFNILYQGLSHTYLKVFPKPNDVNHPWYSDKDVVLGMSSEDSLFATNVLLMVYEFADNGDDQQAIEYIGYIKKFQRRYGDEIMPSEAQIQAELWYNKANLFMHLFYSYWFVGFVLLLYAIVKMFKDYGFLKLVKIGFTIFVGILFLVQTGNMILRWYIAEFPPWSNGYEMIILVSWTTVLFGLIFSRKSNFILPLATLFAGTLLFVAFLDWLNPEITNLVPVLKSYWLKIHVAIIVGSYAPLALSALLSFTAIWIKFGNKRQAEKLTVSYKEVTYLSELSMTIGLYMLTIGTFLGGIWANESWGRYWGWDPKETWALISILVYAIVLHIRIIPGVKNIPLWFNVLSIWAFCSIIMTSFGVNYYLSGLHSYAQGDPVPIPTWVYYFLAVWLITTLVGYRTSKR